jgi:hypothetical protein
MTNVNNRAQTRFMHSPVKGTAQDWVKHSNMPGIISVTDSDERSGGNERDGDQGEGNPERLQPGDALFQNDSREDERAGGIEG